MVHKRAAGSEGIRVDVIVIFAASLPVGVAALLRDSVVAHRFGAGDLVDGLALAFGICLFLFNVVGGAMGPALVPLLAKLHADGRADAALKLSSGVGLRFMLGMGGLALGLAVVAPALIGVLAPNFSEAKRELTWHLLIALLPALFFGGLAAFLAALLQSRRLFLRATLAQLAVPLTVILSVWLLAAHLGIFAVALSIGTGSLLQCGILAFGLRGEARSLVPCWHAPELEMRALWRQYAPMLLGATLMGSTLLVTQVMAARLDPGSVAALSFASVLVTYAGTVGIQMVGGPALRHFSELTARGDWQGSRRFLWRTLAAALMLSGFAAAGIIVLSDWLVDFLFLHGAFTAADAQRVSRVQQLYAMQLPWHIAGVIFSRLLSAMGMNHMLMLGAALSLCLTVTLNYAFMSSLGVAGFALASAITYFLSFVFLGSVALLGVRRQVNLSQTTTP